MGALGSPRGFPLDPRVGSHGISQSGCPWDPRMGSWGPLGLGNPWALGTPGPLGVLWRPGNPEMPEISRAAASCPAPGCLFILNRHGKMFFRKNNVLEFCQNRAFNPDPNSAWENCTRWTWSDQFFIDLENPTFHKFSFSLFFNFWMVFRGPGAW